MKTKRDKIEDKQLVHFDIPLTLEHEIMAIKKGGFHKVELVGFLQSDNNTAMIKAIK